MVRCAFLKFLLLACGVTAGSAFIPSSLSKAARTQSSTTLAGQIDRRDFVTATVAGCLATILAPSVAQADVSDGTSLPQGAQQFARVLRLKSDLEKVKKRVSDAATSMEKSEWENVGQFLRQAYSVTEDMKGVASGIANPDNKKRALQDAEQLKKYAQAGDVSVQKKDGPGFVSVANKMQELVNDFFDSLNDIPDEI